MFNKSIKNLLLTICANNKYSARDLSSKSNPYEYYLPFRDLSLSLILDKYNIYDELSKYIYHLNKTLDDYTKYNSDYKYLQSAEKSIDEFIPTEVAEKHPEKCYFFKSAILIRLYEGLNKITKGSRLISFKDNLEKFDNFKEDVFMSNAFKTMCNVKLIEDEIKTFDVVQYDDSFIEEYFNKVDIHSLKQYLTSFFYWFKNDNFNL